MVERSRASSLHSLDAHHGEVRGSNPVLGILFQRLKRNLMVIRDLPLRPRYRVEVEIDRA